MAVFNKVNSFVADIGLAKFNLNTDDIRVYLTNTLPVATNTVYNTPADLATGGGYTAGGLGIANAYSQTAGVASLTGSNVTWTATGGGFGPFQYVVLYDNTSATKPLIGWWDNGAPITLAAPSTFTVQFSATVLQIQ